MAHGLHTLHRLREHARKAADVDLRKAEAERDRQEKRVGTLLDGLVIAREGLDPGDIDSLATWHAFRLQREMNVRREEARLAQREREVESRRTRHLASVRDELSIEGLIDRREAAEAAEEQRKENVTMDEIAARSTPARLARLDLALTTDIGEARAAGAPRSAS